MASDVSMLNVNAAEVEGVEPGSDGSLLDDEGNRSVSRADDAETSDIRDEGDEEDAIEASDEESSDDDMQETGSSDAETADELSEDDDETAVESTETSEIKPSDSIEEIIKEDTEMVSSTEYSIWVGNTQVTSDCLSGNGWSYDPAANILTLSGADLKTEHEYSYQIYGKTYNYKTGLYIDQEGLTLKITGNNTISGTGTEEGVYGFYIGRNSRTDSENWIKVIGDGTLEIKGCFRGIHIMRPMTVDGPRVYSEGSKNGVYIQEGSLEIKSGSFEASSHEYGISDNYGTGGILVNGGALSIRSDFDATLLTSPITINSGTLYADPGAAVGGRLWTTKGIVFDPETYMIAIPEEGVLAEDNKLVCEKDGKTRPEEILICPKDSAAHKVALYNGPEHAKISFEKSEYYPGETVRFTAELDEGWKLSSVEYAPTLELDNRTPVKGTSFVMPNVNISVIFTLCEKEKYGIYVGGEEIDEVNCGDVLGDGKVSYEGGASGGTLTLKSAAVSAGYEYLSDPEVKTAGIYSMNEALDLTVSLSGDCSISGVDKGIYLSGSGSSVTFAGEGGLECEGSEVGIDSPNISVENGAVVTAKGDNAAILTGTEITLGDDTEMASPTGGSVKESADGMTVYKADGSTISKKVIFGKGIDISNAVVTLGEALTYKSSEQTQSVASVVIDGKTLPESDYVVSGNTATDAGTYTLTVTASEDSIYKGSVTKDFTIAPRSVLADVSLESNEYTYTGKEIKPAVTVKSGSRVFTADEYSVTYEDNVNAGTAKVIVTAAETGNYTFSQKTVTFEIKQAVWSDSNIAITKNQLCTDESEHDICLADHMPAGSGNVVFGEPVVTDASVFRTSPAISDGVLTYSMNRTDSVRTGIITINATTQNYSNEFSISVSISQQTLGLYEKISGKNELCDHKELTVGKSFSLISGFLTEGTDNTRVVWRSSNPDIATVTQSGKVKAVSAGKTTIMATSEAYPDDVAECEVSVTEPVTGVSLDKSKYSFGTGESVSLSVSVLPYTAIQELTWTVSDPSVVKIYDEAGKEELTGEATAAKTVVIKAVGKGSAKVTAAATDGSGKKAVCKFTVGNPVPQNITVFGKGNKTSIVAGKTLTMAVNWGDKSKKPANTGLKWSVEKQGGGDAAAIATISSKGVLTGITAGTVTVKATSTADPGRSGTVDITITAPTFKDPKVTGISFGDTSLLQEKGLYAGKSFTVKTGLTLSGKGKAASGAIAWYSSDPLVAAVSQKGVIKAVAPGSVTITAVTRDAENILTAPSASVSFNVYAAVKSVKIDKKKITIGTQEGSQYGKISVAAIQPYNVTDPSIKWSVNNGNVKLAAIDAGQAASEAEFESAAGEGVTTAAGQALAVMGVTPGVTKLTGMTTDGSRKKVSCTITIRGQVTGLSLSPSTGKGGYNDITVTEDPGVYTGNMKAKSSLTLKPMTDLNGISAISTDKPDKTKYKLYKKYTDTSLSYRSSDTSVATVNNKGKITVKNGVEAGRTCVIYVSSADGVRTIQYKITVK